MNETITNSLVFIMASVSSFLIYLHIEKRYKRYVTAKRFNLRDNKTESIDKSLLSPSFNRLALSLGRLAAPKNKDDISKISMALSHAGYRGKNSVIIFYGGKLGLGLALAAVFLLVQLFFNAISAQSPVLLFIPFGAGYFLPDIILKKKIKSRIEKIFQELPDTLDLLEICLKAGLGFDYALLRVCNELKDIAPTMSNEFGRYFLETKTGLGRETALINLGLRNGSEPLKKVINVLMQSSKIGTDMADALKVYTDTMRREREQAAEEQGAKLSTKLTLPLVIFILPALMLIILGPVIINFMSLVQQGF